ncbi:unnamed protein product [Somion occarium]|uniref:Uncharacterized protein n=1 Tax=Somion occarium TaxID=3059160 RepID=A0ABP1DEH1_9APHY
MASTTSVLIISYALIAMGAPQGIDSEFDDFPEDQPEEGHLDKTWEIVLGVVLSLVVCAVIGTAVWVRIRRKKQRARRTTGYLRGSNPDLSRMSEEGKHTIKVNSLSEEDVIITPTPAAKNQSRRGPYR